MVLQPVYCTLAIKRATPGRPSASRCQSKSPGPSLQHDCLTDEAVALAEELADAWKLPWGLAARRIARVLVRTLQAAALGDADEAVVQWRGRQWHSGSAYSLSYTLTHHERCQ